jgi:DNA repair protein RadD
VCSFPYRPASVPNWTLVTLWPHQTEAICNVGNAFRAGKKRVCLTLPTGAGKTVIIAHIANKERLAGKKVCIIAHREELLDQISDALHRESAPHGFVKSGRAEESHKPLQVAGISSLVNRFDRFRGFDLIIPDECHHSITDEWKKVWKQFPNARGLGLTATPLRLDGRGLNEIYDHLVTGPTTRQLIQSKVLCPYIVYAPKIVDLSGVHSRKGDFITKESEFAMDQPAVYGDMVKCYRKWAIGKSAIAFCTTVSHAEKTAKKFNESGIPSASIDGTMTTRERRQIIADFRIKKILVLTSCELVSEGFDLPGIECAILARPTKSLALFLQQVGRSLRTSPGKERAIIIDHVGNCKLRHGMPDTEHIWSLEGRKPKDKLPSVSNCKHCYAIYESKLIRCPVCGLQRPIGEKKRTAIRTFDADLSEMDSTEVAIVKVARRQAVEQMLRAEAARKGYKLGWVWHQLKVRGLR